MTAEIAALNREAVALAADSAVTSDHGDGKKIFVSANKIFALSRYAPVAVMVYGNALFMKVPWETIVKTYRRKLGKREFATLKQHAEHFREYLEEENPVLFPAEQQDQYAEAEIYGEFVEVREEIERTVEAQTEQAPLAPEKLSGLVSSTITRRRDMWPGVERVATLPDNFGSQIIERYRTVIDRSRQEVFEQLPLTQDDIGILDQILGSLFERWGPTITVASGVVVAGYGRDDIFPALFSFEVEGILNGRLRHHNSHEAKVTHDNTAFIAPFAQREMVNTFMEGIDPNLSRTIDRAITKIVNELPATIIDAIDELPADRKEELKKKFQSISGEALKNHRENLDNLRREKFADPVLGIVSLLPKDELASLAESLVSLTSLKRRVSPTAETVGGPIDVAVISKGDGLIWIKRKHYFSRDLNPQFFANYLREDVDGAEGARTEDSGAPAKSG